MVVVIFTEVRVIWETASVGAAFYIMLGDVRILIAHCG